MFYGLSQKVVTLSGAKGLIDYEGDSSLGPSRAQDKFRMTFHYILDSSTNGKIGESTGSKRDERFPGFDE